MIHFDMTALTQALPTKSAKIRALDQAGVSRADIAAFLGIRYQHVRNVLVSPPPRPSGLAAVQPAPVPNEDAAVGSLTIAEAKRGLALHFGVRIDAIEITIRG